MPKKAEEPVGACARCRRLIVASQLESCSKCGANLHASCARRPCPECPSPPVGRTWRPVVFALVLAGVGVWWLVDMGSRPAPADDVAQRVEQELARHEPPPSLDELRDLKPGSIAFLNGPAADGRFEAAASKTHELLEGSGLAGVLCVGETTPVLHDRLGPALEDRARPFVYEYRGRDFSAVSILEEDDETGGFRVRSLVFEGAGTPPTSKGLKIGDPASRVRELYGEPGPFDGTVSSAMAQDPRLDRLAATSLAYAPLRTFFAVQSGKVAAIGITRAPDLLPVYLREKVGAPRGVAIDRSVASPTLSWVDDPEISKLYPGAKTQRIRLPAPPELEAFDAPTFSGLVPKAWKREGLVWSGAEAESVGFETLGCSPQEGARLAGDALERVPPTRVSPELARTLGGDAWTSCTQARAEESHDVVLRNYALAVSSPGGCVRVVVKRRVLANSPHAPALDADDLARKVFLAFRAKA